MNRNETCLFHWSFDLQYYSSSYFKGKPRSYCCGQKRFWYGIFDVFVLDFQSFAVVFVITSNKWLFSCGQVNYSISISRGSYSNTSWNLFLLTFRKSVFDSTRVFSIVTFAAIVKRYHRRLCNVRNLLIFTFNVLCLKISSVFDYHLYLF